MRNILIVCFAITALIGLAGCGGGLSATTIEREVVARAPELIGPADRYTAQVQGSETGRIALVQLVGTGVRPTPGLRLDALTLTLRGTQYQLTPFRVQSVEQALFDTRVSETALNDYLTQRARPSDVVRNPRVRLLAGGIRAQAGVLVGGTEVPVEAEGQLVSPDGVRVNVVLDRLVVSGVGVPPTVANIVAGAVNPLVDLSGLRFTPRITAIEAQAGAVHITGTADVRNIP